MTKILIVDDNTINLKLAEKILKDVEGYKPVLIPSGARALQFLTKNKPDIILLDIMMPEMDGFEVLAAIKANPANADIPVLFLTADEDEGVEAKAEAAGALGLLRKPFKKDELLALVAKFLPEGDK